MPGSHQAIHASWLSASESKPQGTSQFASFKGPPVNYKRCEYATYLWQYFKINLKSFDLKEYLVFSCCVVGTIRWSIHSPGSVVRTLRSSRCCGMHQAGQCCLPSSTPHAQSQHRLLSDCEKELGKTGSTGSSAWSRGNMAHLCE